MSSADQHKETYKEEAYELLEVLESSLLELEDRKDDSELIDSIFRALHTIKGSGSMFGFDDIAAFTHEVETVFDMVRNNELTVTKELIDLTLSSQDHILKMLNGEDDQKASESRGNEIIASLKKLLPQEDTKEETVTHPDSENERFAENGRETIYRINFHPNPDIFNTGLNPVLLLDELRDLGHCNILAHTDSVPKLQNIDPESCYTYWDAVLTTDKGINAIKDVFIFVEDDCELEIEVIGTSDEFEEGFENKKIGEIFIERGYITREAFEDVLNQKSRIGETLVQAGLVGEQEVESALIEQQHIKEIKSKHEKKEPASSIKVSSEKLDCLVNLVGELVTVQARLTQTAASKNDSQLNLIAEEVERLTEELRDNTMSVRLVPIGTLFSKFKRLIRDLSKEMNKSIQLIIEGADTELDKNVIDKLNDPLVHLIRNSIDHGIETSDSREAVGKPKQGMLCLSAKQSGANVLIEITDDGAGLDAEAIRAKAIERGLIDANAELSEQAIFAQILTAGFSTAKEITNVSGRGVGMDVVKRNIDSLRGRIDIKSQKGIGTTVTLRLPLTLAIIDGLLVKLGEDSFVLPLSLVEECIELTDEDIAKAHGRKIANVRGEIVPYISLRDTFFVNGSKPDIEQIVITRVDDHRVGFVVDDVIGEHQTVIKSLGTFYKHVEGVSGATILGDGSVALIIDIPKLVQTAEIDEASKNNHDQFEYQRI